MVTEASFNSESAPVASIIVVGWRNAPLLLDCLASVQANVADYPYELLLVLNEPTPQLRTDVAMHVRGARVWEFSTNLGFGGAVNLAATQARGDYLILLNDDSVVEPNWLEALVETAERRQRCGAVGSTFLHLDGSLQEAGSVLWDDGTTAAVGDGGVPGNWDFERRVDYCSGGSLLVRRDLWLELGGLDERYYPAYYEDVDFCLRLQEAGWQVWYQPLSRVRHVRSASTPAPYRGLLGELNRGRFCQRWPELLADRQPKGQVELAVWQAMGRPTRVLVIDDRLPTPSLGSGLGRMHDALMAMAADPTTHVCFHPRLGLTPEAVPYTRVGIRIVLDLAGHLAKTGVGYDAVVISRPHNGELLYDLVRTALPDVPIIYDAEALYYRRIEQQVALATDPEQASELARQAEHMRKVELDLVRKADQIVCISDTESEIVASHSDRPIATIDAWLASPRPSQPGFGGRNGIGMVAGWLAGPGSPNADGLLWFAREVLPLIRARLPAVRLLVTGGSPPPDVNWLQSDLVSFVGALPELPPFYDQIRVAISPVRFGSGVKLKTVEAIQYNVPMVATEEGAAGLDLAWRRSLSVSDDPRGFAAAVVDLLTDENAWNRARAAQQAAVRSADVTRQISAWPGLLHTTVARSVQERVER